jgi:Protein of unknown function (DUF2958)
MTRTAQLARIMSNITRLTEFDWRLELIDVIALTVATHSNGVHPVVVNDATTVRRKFNPHRPCQPKAAATAGDASTRHNLAFMSCVSTPAGPCVVRALVNGPLGLPLECDLHFAPTLTISAYAERAREHRRIVT